MTEKLLEKLSVNVVNSIQKVEINEDKMDWPYWMPEIIGVFSCKSAWQIVREKKK